jgi:DNA end-binding protein Ku
LRTPEDLGLPEPVKPGAAEVKRIEQEIARRVEDRLDTAALVDRQKERLLKLARRKLRSGKDVAPAPATDEGGSQDIIDLMEMLQRSLTGGSSRRAHRETGEAGALSESSKAELYERARELDIPGRSGMSKAELIRAIRKSA